MIQAPNPTRRPTLRAQARRPTLPDARTGIRHWPPDPIRIPRPGRHQGTRQHAQMPNRHPVHAQIPTAEDRTTTRTNPATALTDAPPSMNRRRKIVRPTVIRPNTPTAPPTEGRTIRPLPVTAPLTATPTRTPTATPPPIAPRIATGTAPHPPSEFPSVITTPTPPEIAPPTVITKRTATLILTAGRRRIAPMPIATRTSTRGSPVRNPIEHRTRRPVPKTPSTSAPASSCFLKQISTCQLSCR